MITVISGTNNNGNKTSIFAQHTFEVLKSKTSETVKFLDLEHIPHDYFSPEMYDRQAASITKIQDEYIIPAEKFYIISPEYNGGISGALKLFLDACSIREYKASFKGKKAALIGIASGRAGNLRGLDQLSSILNHVGTIVLPNKLPISSIKSLLNEQEEIVASGTLTAIEQQLDAFLNF
ncbi:MAG: NAD(P)H-dependent oxidoreductase [Bacteroidota bacterium]